MKVQRHLRFQGTYMRHNNLFRDTKLLPLLFIKPLLASGIDVVLDRFWWSTWVYATLEGVPARSRDLMIELETQSWETIEPEMIFLVLRGEPLLRQPDINQWLEKLKLYKQLFELQKDNLPIELVVSDCSPSEVLKKLLSSIHDKVGQRH